MQILKKYAFHHFWHFFQKWLPEANHYAHKTRSEILSRTLVSIRRDLSPRVPNHRKTSKHSFLAWRSTWISEWRWRWRPNNFQISCAGNISLRFSRHNLKLLGTRQKGIEVRDSDEHTNLNQFSKIFNYFFWISCKFKWQLSLQGCRLNSTISHAQQCPKSIDLKPITGSPCPYSANLHHINGHQCP